jgi:uncharacterized DUF497 family protein
MEYLKLEDARALLHHCLEEGRIISTRHFREELANEQLTFEDAWTVLRSGTLYQEPDQDLKTGEWKYRVEGYEPGGKWLVVVVCFKTLDTAALITVFSVTSKGRK